MKEILVDTSAWMAVVDSGDVDHQAAVTYQNQISGQCRLVVTSCVLDELCTLVLSVRSYGFSDVWRRGVGVLRWAKQQETGDLGMGHLTEELRQAVDAHRGFLEVDAGDSTYVVMSMSVFREMMGVGTDDEYQASLRAIEEGWADVQTGRSRPLDEFLREFDRKHGIPR